MLLNFIRRSPFEASEEEEQGGSSILHFVSRAYLFACGKGEYNITYSGCLFHPPLLLLLLEMRLVDEQTDR